MHHFSKQWIQYSFEKTMDILRRNFLASNIIIVRPCRQYNGRSFYDQFTTEKKSIFHVSALLQSFYRNTSQDVELPVHLIGFSKGVVVLNALIADLTTVVPNQNQQDDGQLEGNIEESKKRYTVFWKNIQSLYLLDSSVYPTPDVCSSFCSLLKENNISLNTYATEGRINNEQRPRTGQEYYNFVNQLTMHKVNFHSEIYPGNTLKDHFEVLHKFKGIT